MEIGWYCGWAWVNGVRAVFVQSFVESCFCLTNILYFAFATFHQVYDEATAAVGFVEDFVFLICDIACEYLCFFYLFTTAVSHGGEAGTAFP